MGFNLNGYVLRPARLATGNAVSTGEATTGVCRDHIEPGTMGSLGYDILPSRPVEPYADMYRAAVLLRPDKRVGTDEYIIWAATTGSFSTVESAAFQIEGDPAGVTASAGSLTVGAFDDGTDTLFVEDLGGRDLASVTVLTLIRGDLPTTPITATFSSQDPLIGRVVLDGTTLTSLGGGFSPDRGDTVSQVSYILAGPKFWWSRNDSVTTRFGWNGKNARWEPFQGSLPQNLGASGEEDNYELSPPPSRFSVGDLLPGDSGTPDAFALIRAGLFPDASAVPLNVLVVSDADTQGDYPTAGLPYDAVVGVNNGILLLNPAWLTANSGLTLWYNPESFRSDADGDLGKLEDLPTDSTLGFPSLSPIPGPTERPFVRLGFRRPLTPIAVDTDADLPLPSAVSEREFYWSRSTGKIVLSEFDIKKAIPGEVEYDIRYLEARVYYDGVSLSTQPLPFRNPSPAVNASGDDLIGTAAGGSGIPGSGDLFIKKAVPLPPPGFSGVKWVPDGSGDQPDLATDPQTRPNGSGLVRDLQGIGDTFLFASSKAFEDLEVEEYERDIPTLKIKVKRTEAVTAREQADPQPTGYDHASRFQIKRRGIRDEGLYFLQCEVAPAVYSDEARLYTRYEEPFDLAGTELLRFAIDGTTYTWDASVLPPPAGTAYTAQEIATSINLLTGGSNAVAIRGRVALQSATLTTGSVEIGWNTDPDDLSGHSVLGLLPGWRVDASGTTFRWQPDNGSAIGLYRSPENLDRSERVADINAVGRFEGEILTDSVSAVPFYNVNVPPLEDLPGYDEGVHFVSVLGLNIVRLSNYGVSQGIGVKYDWANDRLIWTEQGSLPSTPILEETDTLQLPNQYVLPETVSSEAMLPTGLGYGLYLKDAGDLAFTELLRDVDFIMPGDGAPGQARLITPEGSLVTSGGGGQFTAGGSFSNPDLSPDATQNILLQAQLLAAVEPGYRLQVLNGDGAGVYTITAKTLVGTDATFDVTPPFPVTDTGVSWQVFEGQELDVYDSTVIADVKQVPFNHLPEEPWKIRLLSSTGTVGGALTAVVADALSSGRATRIRFGLEQPPTANEASVSYLEQGIEVGVIKALGLLIPEATDPHFTNSSGAVSYFAFRIGSNEFSSANTNLSVVTTFSPTIPAGTIEVGEDGSLIAGEIRFADDVLADFEGETVYYDQIFLAPALLGAGTAEINPDTGAVNLSSADSTSFAGELAYFVEEMITEDSLDVTISPLNGSILFNKPLRSGQLVESQYFTADTSGNQVQPEVVEYLPLRVELEEATAITDSVYSFNPTGRTLGARGEEFVWVGVELQNFAGEVTATVNDDSTIQFAGPVPTGETVQINYFVLEAFGGEQGYTVSTFPVYRMPFFLEAEQDTFTLEKDRTDDIEVGQLALLGPVPFWVKAVSYNGSTDETEVTFWPPPQEEAGSRAPGKDSGFTLSDRPVAITIDPAGSPVAGGGSEGFLIEVDTTSPTGTPFEPADVGQTDIVFVGDVTRFARTAHLLEVGGYPYIIVASQLSDDGRFTRVSVGNPVYKAHSVPADTVRISVRPVYQPDPVEFAGVSAFVEDEGFTLFLLGSRDSSGNELPGRQLVEGIHYAVDPATGAVTFKKPVQPPLQPGETLVASYSALDPLGPIVINDAVVAPAYRSQYLFISTPSLSNRVQGSTLAAKYTFKAPDTFYWEVLTLRDYLGEVAEVALSKVSGGSRTGGPPTAFAGSPDNSKQGALGIRGNVQDLQDQDRAARAYIELYNGVVLAFEQILEAIDGRIIGDRDGKFRFFVGHDKRYAPPGWEDTITGNLVRRLVWREIVEEWADPAPLLDGYYEEDDPVFDPVTAFEKNPATRPGETDGDTPNPDTLAFYTRLQRFRVKNDMDDRLLIGFGRPRGLAFLFPAMNVPGLFKDMWEPHVYSRLFPERTRHFTRLFPGLEAQQAADGSFTDPGFYSSGRKLTVDGPEPGETSEQTIKTRKSVIGVIANPAFGNITGVVDVTAEDRFPRARVWRYFPNGDAQLDAALGVSTVGKATIVATPLPLGEFPIDPATGFPDTSQLISNPPGSLFDLNSGDPDLSTPGWESGQQVFWGTPAGPSGTVYFLQDSKGNGIFVDEILEGCVVTLKDRKDNSIAGADVLVNGSQALEDVVSGEGGRGDTFFVGPPVMDLDDIPEDGDNPTLDQIAELAQSIPSYRIQFDLKVGKRTGEFLDASLPVREDQFPLPLQKMFGQKPPQPLTCIEGVVEFVNVEQAPLKLPALQGQPFDDAGDAQIPYLQGTDTELTVLSEVAAGFQVLLSSDSSFPIPYTPVGAGTDERQLWLATLPDEIVLNDGEIWEFATTTAPTPPADQDRSPATLYTSRDLKPVATAGSYTAGSAIGDVRRWDFMLVEAGQPLVGTELNVGMTGILNIGEVTSNGLASPDTLSTLEPARFVTSMERGSPHKYSLQHAWGHLAGGFPSPTGVEFSASFGGGFWTNTIDFSTAGIVLDSDNGGLLGGLVALLGTGNAAVINIYDPDPGAATAYIGSITISGLLPGATLWVYNNITTTVTPLTLAGAGIALATPSSFKIDTAGSSIQSLLPIAGSPTTYDFTISIDTFITGFTSALTSGGLAAGSAPGSTTCSIDRDRLTFNERVSLASALPRNSFTANNTSDLGVRLNIIEMTVGGVSDCSVNEDTEVNGGTPFSFETRVGPSPDGTVPDSTLYVGTFLPGSPATANGTLKVMGWEGFGNAPLPFPTDPVSGVILSAVPSSDLDETGVILEGIGTMRDASAPAGTTVNGLQHWIDSTTIGTGSLGNPVKGDILVVDSDGSGGGAVKAGTYLLRHVVDTNATALTGAVPVLAQALASDAGSRKTLDLQFPTVKSVASPVIILEGVPSVPESPVGCGFDTSGFLYLVLRSQYASYDSGSTTYTVDPDSVYRMGYTAASYDANTGEATLVMDLGGTIENAVGGAITATEFFAAATRGRTASGMVFFPVAPRTDTGLPENNVVGWEEDDIGTALTAGFRTVIMGNLNDANHGGPAGTSVTSKLWDKAATSTDIRRLLLISDNTPAGEFGVRVPSPFDSTEFYQDQDTVIYGRQYVTASSDDAAIRGVPSHVALDGLTTTNWNEIHFDTASGITAASHRLRCLLPGDRVMLGDDLEAPTVSGFWALSGLFLETSWPRPVTNLGLLFPHVVAASWPLTGQTGQVGSRDFSDFTGSAVYSESVHFYVRRIRRFHEAQAQISNNLELLKYTFEMRRGDFLSYTAATRTFTAGTATYGEATNVGPFTDPLVNINAGDLLRVLDADGNLLDTAEVQKVTGATTLLLRRPGLTASLTGATSFEVYLEQAIVPHEQSNEQLLDLVTDQVVFERKVDYGAGDVDGGRVPTTANTMQDTLVADWATEGVQEGDYVIIDPAGPLYQPGEEGVRPFGDQSVAGRAPFVAGAPSNLDDNRGFYRVETVAGTDLSVDGSSRFGGSDPTGSDDVVLGGPGAEYAVLPTVGASVLTGGAEGQQTLRLTAPPVAFSYGDRVGLDLVKSIEPFPYKIIRPSAIFSEDALELVLFNRERVLSLIEEVRGVYQNGKGGDYYVFQRDDHIEDVGSPTNPTAGAGLISNLLITSLEGLVGVTPYANVSDCLSVLGRRFWVLDTRLDAGGYTDFLDDGFDQRPVLPDLIEDVLDLDDRFRDLRYSWIRFRADRVNGSITQARQAEDQLPDELQKQQELIDQRKALESS